MSTQNFNSNVSQYIRGRFNYTVTDTSIKIKVQLWRTNKYSAGSTGSSGSYMYATIDGSNRATVVNNGNIIIPATTTANSSYSSSNSWDSPYVTFSNLEPGTTYTINFWSDMGPYDVVGMDFDEYIDITTTGTSGGGGDEPDDPPETNNKVATITCSSSGRVGESLTYRLGNTGTASRYYYWYYVEMWIGNYRAYYGVFRENESGLTSDKTISLGTNLMNYIPSTSTSVTARVQVETFLGDRSVPDYDLLVGTNSVSALILSTNYGLSTGTVNITAQSTPITNTYIQNKTTLKIAWSNIAPSLGANLTLMEIIYGDMIKTYKNSAIETSGNFITIPIQNSGNVQVYIRLTDSRGYTLESSKTTLNVVEYQFPQPTMTVERYSGTQPDSRGNTIKSLIDWTYSSLSGQNSITKRELWLTPINEEQWTKKIDPVQKNVLQTLSGTYSQSQSYQAKFIIEDTVGSHVEKVVNIGTEPVIMDLHNGGDGLAFGKVSEGAGLEISYPTKFDNGTTYGEIGNIIWFGDPGKEYGLRIDDEDVIVYFNGESFNLYDTLTSFDRRITALEERG